MTFPRSDLTVKIGNTVIKPALALVNWAGAMMTKKIEEIIGVNGSVSDRLRTQSHA